MEKRCYVAVLVAVLAIAVFGCQQATSPEGVQRPQESGLSGWATGQTGSFSQATVFHDNFTIPVDETLFSSCAGEEIYFTGAIHVVVHTVEGVNGSLQSHATSNDQNVSGVGVSSGNRYRRVGASTSTANTSGPPPLEFTTTNSFHFIGQGASNNTLVTETIHVTVNANGEQTASIENFRFECR